MEDKRAWEVEMLQWVVPQAPPRELQAQVELEDKCRHRRDELYSQLGGFEVTNSSPFNAVLVTAGADRHAEIATLAYWLWRAGHHREGMDLAFWLQAEREWSCVAGRACLIEKYTAELADMDRGEIWKAAAEWYARGDTTRLHSPTTDGDAAAVGQ